MKGGGYRSETHLKRRMRRSRRTRIGDTLLGDFPFQSAHPNEVRGDQTC